MKTNKKNLMMMLMMICCLTIHFNAQAQRFNRVADRPGVAGAWRALGTVHARHTADHDVLVVPGPYDFYRRIKLNVTDSPVNMVKIVVRYDDGGAPEIISTRIEIPRGGESRVIDLRGTKRKLKGIEFWYDTAGLLDGQADVTVFAMK